jgi:hypothetical protein
MVLLSNGFNGHSARHLFYVHLHPNIANTISEDEKKKYLSSELSAFIDMGIGVKAI